MKNDGGPAFPNSHTHPKIDLTIDKGILLGWQGKSGMSLRDYFAGQALHSFKHEHNPTNLAIMCYEVADAMLKQREK